MNKASKNSISDENCGEEGILPQSNWNNSLALQEGWAADDLTYLHNRITSSLEPV